MLRVQDILSALQKTITSVSQDDLERFVRFLEVNRVDRINYVELMTKIEETKKSHDPFKNLVSRLNYFLKNNQITPAQLIKKISDQCTNDKFAEFLRQKVDKKATIGQLVKLTQILDVDKDGSISEYDI